MSADDYPVIPVLPMDIDTIDFLRTCVSRGAAFLDRAYPEWVAHVNIDTLSLIDNKCCVIGQLCGDFFEAVLTMGQHTQGSVPALVEWAASLGFTVDEDTESDYGDATWDVLTSAWKKEVGQRKVTQ